MREVLAAATVTIDTYAAGNFKRVFRREGNVITAAAFPLDAAAGGDASFS